MICRNLRGQGIDIRHIIDHDTTETQDELEKRLIAQLKLHPDMFKDTDPNALVERAYEVQGDRIAYVEKGERETDEPVTESGEKNPLIMNRRIDIIASVQQ